VKVNRGGTHAPEYVQRIDRSPVQMTLNRQLALVMGKFTAEDAIKSIRNARRFLNSCRSRVLKCCEYNHDFQMYESIVFCSVSPSR
jgi:hypothetical protein